MALCTICLADPCPHLMMRGGTAGAPMVAVGIAAKYAPSARPHCPSCDRIHRNIGTDNQPVCAWRTYSKAKGLDFETMTPDNVDEFASWFRAGTWAAPTRKSKAKAAPAPAPAPSPAGSGGVVAPVILATTSSPVAPVPVLTTVSVPVIEDEPPAIVLKEEDAPAIGAHTKSKALEEAAHAAQAVLDAAPKAPRKAPAFSKGKTIKDEARTKEGAPA